MRIVNKYPFFYRIIFDSRIAALFVPLRALAALLYIAGYYFKSFFEGRKNYSDFRKGRANLPSPKIISIGNLEVGGTGKTPVSLELASEMMKRGASVVVVMRGYGRKNNGKDCIVVPSSDNVVTASSKNLIFVPPNEPPSIDMAGIIGDEAMIYRERGIPLVVDRDRRRGTKLAVEIFNASHIILDDAFQHRKLPRDIDIALVDYSSPLGNGSMLPLGTLREPPSALKRADIVIATRAKERKVPREIVEIIDRKPFFISRHRLHSLVGVNGEEFELRSFSGRNVVLFSAIARPQSFEADCKEAGYEIEVSIRFLDHHKYTVDDIKCILTSASSEETIFFTTEKDFYKVGDIFPEPERLFAVRLRAEIEELRSLIELCL